MLTRHRPWLALAAVIAMIAGLLIGAAVPAQASGPAITLSKKAPGSVLADGIMEYSLTVANPGSSDAVPEYNVSISDLLPVGVVYVGGSTSPAGAGEPTTGVDPVTGRQVLVWSNIADLQVAADVTITFQARVLPDALVGAFLLNDATALSQQDPRLVPDFTSSGAPVPGSFSEQASASAITRVGAISIDKSEPSPESELLRGVHQHTTTYTLTVTNNDEGNTQNVTVTDYLPAGLEFLGCGGIDNTPNGAVEYPGAPRLTGTPAVSSCVYPDAVETVTNPGPIGGQPLAPGVYTKLTWTSSAVPQFADLAVGAVITLKYAAGIPLRANTDTWPNGEPSAASGEQGANLENNTGASTREPLSERTWANLAHVEGDYTGTTTTGLSAVEDTDTETVVAEDLRILKSVSPTTFTRDGIATYSLAIATSEYVSAKDIVVTDVVPDGLCPLGDVANYSPSLAPECAPGPSLAPSIPFASVDSAADGTYAIEFAPIATLAPSGTSTITFKARMQQAYTGASRAGVPTAAGDTFTNRVSLIGDTTPIAGTGETGDVTVADTSSATQTSEAPTLTKTMKPRALDPDCAVDSGYATPDLSSSQWTFRKGDVLCFKLRVEFPQTIRTRNPVITDFLPYDSVYLPGSAQVTASNTATIASFNQAGVMAGDPPTWTLGQDSAGVLFEPAGSVFEVTLAVTITEAATPPVPDLVGNLMKMRTEDTAGRGQSYRASVDFRVAPAANVSITKGVAQIDGQPVPPNGPDVDGLTVRESQRVTYRVDVTNAGRSGYPGADYNIRGLQVWDVLPPGITCAMVDSSSFTWVRTGGTEAAVPAGISACTDPGDPNQPTFALRATRSAIAWRFPSPDASSTYRLSTGDVMTLTYAVTMPSELSVSTTLTNTASVRSFSAYTNTTGGTTTYYPADNIDTSVPVTVQDAEEATDPSNVKTPDVAVSKSLVTSIVESNNNLSGQATIGETVTYTVGARIPAGTTVYNAVLTDPLPTGLTFVSASAGFSATGTSPATAPLPAGMSLDPANGTVTFPAVYNNTDTTDHLVEVTIVSIVNNTTGSNTHGTVRTNTAAFSSQTAATGGTALPARQATARFTIVLASPTLTKSASPLQVFGGQVVTFRLTAGNTTGRPPSHDTVVVDCLPEEFDFIAATPPGGTTVATPTAGDGTNGCAVGTTRIEWTIGTLLAGTSARKVLTYTAQLKTTPAPVSGSTLTNTAALSGSSINGPSADEATFTRNASATVTVVTQQISKGVSPQSATIGETVTYTVTVALPANVAYPNAAITDTLPSGIDPTSITTVDVECAYEDLTACASLPGDFGTDLTRSSPSSLAIGWLLGSLSSDVQQRFITVTYTAVVQDTSGPAAGDDLVNTAVGRWNQTPGTEPTTVTDALALSDDTDPASATLHVTEPDVTLDKSVDDASPEPGDTFSYTIDALVGNVPAEDRSAAYDLTIVDTIPAGIVVDESTISDGGTYDSGTRTITWNPASTPILAGPIAVGDTVTLTYSATLDDSASLPPGALVNSVEVTSYFSLSSTDPGRREYSSAPATESVTPDLPALTLEKTAESPAIAYIGKPFEWTLTISNNSSATATAVDAIDALPRHWAYVADSASVTIDSQTIALEPSIEGGETLTWTDIGDLAPGESAIVVFKATPTRSVVDNPGVGSAIPHTNAGRATWHDAGGGQRPDYGSPIDTASAHIDSADLALTKTYTAVPPLTGDEVMAGETFDWTISVTNDGPDDAVGPFTVTDVLPSGLDFVSGTGTGWTCSLSGDNVTVTCETAPTTLSSGSSLPDITITVRVPADTPDQTQFDNVAVASSRTYDPDESNNSDNDLVTTSTESDLRLVKSQPGSYVVGGEVTYTLQVHNLGPSYSAAPVTVTDTLPAGLSILSIDGGDLWLCSPDSGAATSLQCDAQYDVPLTGIPPIAVTVRVDAPPGSSNAVNTAVVTPTTPDPDPSNNTDSVTDPVVDGVDLELAKSTTGANPVTAGESTQFTITVDNAGPAEALNVSVTDVLDSGLLATAASGAGWTCGVGSGIQVTCTRDRLAAAQTSTILVTAQVQAWVAQGTSLSNVATVTSSSPDTGTRPDSDDSAVLVNAVADLVLTKSHRSAAEPLTPGSLVSFDIDVRNDGPSDAAGPITIADALPNGFDVVSLSSPSDAWTCVTTGRDIECSIPTSLPAGTAAPTLTINTRVVADRTDYANVAAVTTPTTESSTDNNTDTDTVLVEQVADVSIVKSHNGTPRVGERMTFTLAVANAGPSTARRVVVRDRLPDGLAFVAASGRDWTCTETRGQLTCRLAGPLISGTSAAGISVRVKVEAAAYPSVANTATVTTTTTDRRPGNNTSTDRIRPDRGTPEVTGRTKWPRDLTPDRPSTIDPGRRTTSGQRTRTTVTCAPVLRLGRPAGDVSYCTVTPGSRGRVTVTPRGPFPLLVTVTVSAPATRGYTAYRDLRTYVVRR